MRSLAAATILILPLSASLACQTDTFAGGDGGDTGIDVGSPDAQLSDVIASDAPTGTFCESQSPTSVFCDDWDSVGENTAPATKWNSSAGAGLGTTISNPLSHPYAFEAKTVAASATLGSLQKNISVPWKTFQAGLRIVAGSPAEAITIKIGALTMTFGVNASGTSLMFTAIGSATASFTLGNVDPYWHGVGVSIDSPNTISVYYGPPSAPVNVGSFAVPSVGASTTLTIGLKIVAPVDEVVDYDNLTVAP